VCVCERGFAALLGEKSVNNLQQSAYAAYGVCFLCGVGF